MTSASKDCLVTIVIPYFQGSATIARCLRSLSRQTQASLTVIVVVDTDDDKDDELILSTASNFGLSCKVIHKVNGGQSSARNLGISMSKSEYVGFLDQDDEFLPEHIERLVSVLSDFNLDYAWGDLVVKENQSNQKVSGVRCKIFRGREITRSQMLLRGATSAPGALMIRRASFPANLFSEELRGFEDDLLALQLISGKWRGVFLCQPVLMWHQNPVSSSYNLEFFHSRLIFWEMTKKLPHQRPTEKIVRLVTAIRFDVVTGLDIMRFQSSDISRIDSREQLPATPLPKEFFLSRWLLAEVGLRKFLARRLIVHLGRLAVIAGLVGDHNRLRFGGD